MFFHIFFGFYFLIWIIIIPFTSNYKSGAASYMSWKRHVLLRSLDWHIGWISWLRSLPWMYFLLSISIISKGNRVFSFCGLKCLNITYLFFVFWLYLIEFWVLFCIILIVYWSNYRTHLILFISSTFGC